MVRLTLARTKTIRDRSLQENWKYQGNISCKMGTIKDRNGKDLAEAEDTKEGWQEYTEEPCTKA